MSLFETIVKNYEERKEKESIINYCRTLENIRKETVDFYVQDIKDSLGRIKFKDSHIVINNLEKSFSIKYYINYNSKNPIEYSVTVNVSEYNWIEHNFSLDFIFVDSLREIDSRPRTRKQTLLYEDLTKKEFKKIIEDVLIEIVEWILSRN